MGKSAVRPSHSGTDEAPAAVAAPRTQGRRAPNVLTRLLTPIASLRLTVWLMALSLLLVFCGTLAQVDQGIWTVLNRYFRSAMVWIPLQIFVQFGQIFFGLSPTLKVPGSFPFPGGWLLGGLLLANLLAAHAVRFRLNWKRSGILLIHSGLVVMMVSELITGLFAVEGRMTIEEGSSSNFVEILHATELAVVDASDPKVDDVVVIPAAVLRKGGVIRNDLLPFDIEVVKFMTNSVLQNLPADGTPNPATAGVGLEGAAVERPETSGTASDVDIPSTYVTFQKKGMGESLGTYLLSAWFLDSRPQQVSVDGKAYDVNLRFRRAYKPYHIHLNEFRHDKYIGTDIPKNYSSLVRVTDPAEHVDREVLIRMNEPLRYAGETFYQADFLKDGRKGTVLQVVRNPGWLMPYVSCAMVAVGMIVHFLLHLVGFLRVRFAL